MGWTDMYDAEDFDPSPPVEKIHHGGFPEALPSDSEPVETNKYDFKSPCEPGDNVFMDPRINYAPQSIREFPTGATRDTDTGKIDPEGFLSPMALERYFEYMHSHRVQSDGSLRDSDNWQKGIPLNAYMKSGWRHFFDWWRHHRCLDKPGFIPDYLEKALCAVIFNAFGYLHEILKAKNQQ